MEISEKNFLELKRSIDSLYDVIHEKDKKDILIEYKLQEIKGRFDAQDRKLDDFIGRIDGFAKKEDIDNLKNEMEKYTLAKDFKILQSQKKEAITSLNSKIEEMKKEVTKNTNIRIYLVVIMTIFIFGYPIISKFLL